MIGIVNDEFLSTIYTERSIDTELLTEQFTEQFTHIKCYRGSVCLIQTAALFRDRLTTVFISLENFYEL